MFPLRKLIPFTTLALPFALAASAMPHEPQPSAQIERYRSLLSQIPRSVEEMSSERPRLKSEISTSYQHLRSACPAMSRVDISSPWNLADWMNRRITKDEWSQAPYSFRMDSFRAVSVQKNTETKTELLGKLYASLPFHPSFIIWVDDGRERFSQALHQDGQLNQAKRNWSAIISDDEKLKKYISQVAYHLMGSFLPGVQHSMPAIEIHREHVGYRGQFYNNVVKFNLSDEPRSIKTPYDLDTTIAHEYFHFIENILKDWSVAGTSRNNIALQDAGDKFFYSFHGRLAYVSNVTDDTIYRQSFHERVSYYVMEAAGKPKSFFMLSHQQDWLENLNRWSYGGYSEAGHLPAACFIK